MRKLESAVDVIFELVIKQIAEVVIERLMLSEVQPYEFQTAIGPMVYYPYTATYASVRVTYNDILIYSTGRRYLETEGDVKIKQELMHEHVVKTIRAVIKDIPASYGPEKVSIDLEDLTNLISLVKAMAPGEIPEYVKRIEKDITKGIETKMDYIIGGEKDPRTMIGNIKRLEALLNK
ncbi:hypothetical protein D5W64_13405 [Salmonella enterica subsp. enterica serovar Saintpaul]|nr:hypothetical protein [Salmonella enterica subsp. enterica serovar Saintpaul]